MKAPNFTAKANRALTLTLFFYGQHLVFMVNGLKCDVCPWFWANFSIANIGLFLGTYFLGEYRHFKRLEE